MIEGKIILEGLRTLYKNALTQQALARQTGVSQGYICDLLSGRKDTEAITIKTLKQLFPHATLILDSRSMPPVHQLPRDTDSFSKIIDSEELSAEEKIKFIKVLKK